MSATDHVIAQTTDLQDGQMKEVSVGETKMLLARVGGTFYATGAKCPHYGGPLAEGVLCQDRVMCPWHKSCFRVTDGALMDPPALDGLARYPVRIANGQVLVSLPEPEPSAPTPPVLDGSEDARHFVILGAGAAGVAAAEALRFAGYAGRITMVSHEKELPYDRPQLSKEWLSGKSSDEDLPLRPEEFYARNRIDRLTREIVRLDTGASQVRFSSGDPLTYDSVLLATGSVPVMPDIRGIELGNIHLLRSEADAHRIAQSAKPGVRAVVVGGSFIALEVASCLGTRKIPVTVVVEGEAPFAEQLGVEVGKAAQRVHEREGTAFRLRAKVKQFNGTGVVRSVTLESGETLPADVVIVGTGVRPMTNYVAGLAMHPDCGVIVDDYLRAASNVYAAGDIAVFPDHRTYRMTRIEHWRVAQQHGRVAAQNMAGGRVAFRHVPYFWTNHYNKRFDYVGHAKKWDDLIVHGDLEKPEFVAYYVEKGNVTAAVGFGRDRDMCAIHELFRLNAMAPPDELRQGADPLELLRRTTETASRAATAG